MARFKKGQKNPKARENGKKGGRPTKLQQEVKRLAADAAKKYLEDHLKPIMDAYISAASGKRCGRFKRKFDPATCRHAMERFIGPAPRSLILDLQDSVESFFEQVEKMGSEESEEGKTEEEGKS